MELLKPRNILLIYLFAMVLHPLFYLSDFSREVLDSVDVVVSILLIAITSAGIATIATKGVDRSRWGYLALLLMFFVTRVQILLEYFEIIPTLVTFDDINAAMVVHGSIFAFMFILYPVELLRPKFFNIRRLLEFFAPILLLISLAYVAKLFLVDVANKIIRMQLVLGYVIITAYPFLTLLYAFRIEKKHYKWCVDNYSNLESVSVSWIKYYLWAYICLHFSYTYIYFNYSLAAIYVQAILFFVFVVLTLPFVLRQQPLQEREIESLSGDEIDENGDFDDALMVQSISNLSRYKERLLDYMEAEKPFLNPNFKLSDLSVVLPMNRSYISKLLNDEIGETFYDFTARYRVEYSKKLLRSRRDLTISAIAMMSGFNSSSVFGRTFAKYEDMSPKIYRDCR